MSIIQTFPLSPSVDTSDCMKKGVDYVTAGAATGSTIGSNATAEGNDVVASGEYSHAEGCETTADGSYAHAEGFQTSASDYGHAEGYLTTAEGYIAHAEGYSTYSYGTGSHSEGESTFAEGQRSHAEGYGTIASGEAAHTEGGYTTAAGDYSHAEGYYTYAEGNYSHAEGYCTTAYSDNQTVVGKYNIVDTNRDYAFIVGNGTSTTASNALGVKWDGTVEAGGHALGTAAFKNIPSSGNAGNSEVVLGNDSRLSDSRTPTSHTHTKSEITDFPTLGTAAAKDYTSSVTQSSSDLVTSGAVWTAIDNLPEPMVFKGTLGTGGTITSLPTAAAANHGDTYKVITAGTYASIVAKVGDVFTSDGSSWVLIPSGDTDTDTWRAIKVNGTEKLGSAISTGAVDFVNGTNTTISFDATGSKISFSATDEKVTALDGNPSTNQQYYPLFVPDTQNQNPLYNDGFMYTTVQGTSSSLGYSILSLGNFNSSGSNGNKYGQISLYSKGHLSVRLFLDDVNVSDFGSYNIKIPTYKNGTIALTSDITITGIKGDAESSYRTGDVNLTAANVGAVPATTYEYNKEIAFGSSGKLLIGKFPCYDSNVTITISATTSTTYHCTAILATQNINTSGGGTFTWRTYGDSSNSVTPNLYAKYVSGSNVIEIYFSPTSWSKNLVHIQCNALSGAPTNICENVSSIPSEANRQPTNTLTSMNTTGSSGSCTGNAATATKATQDGSGNTITSTYAKLSSANTFSGINTFSGSIALPTTASSTNNAIWIEY